MVRTIIALKVVSSMFAIGMAAGLGVMALCKYNKSGMCGKSKTQDSDSPGEIGVRETP